MDEELKSGKQIVDEFFSNIENISGLDQKIVQLLKTLYSENKLTKKNIEAKLEAIRENGI